MAKYIEVRAIIGTKANGEPIIGRKFTARDADHADRIISRAKGQLRPGSSTYFTRHEMS